MHVTHMMRAMNVMMIGMPCNTNNTLNQRMACITGSSLDWSWTKVKDAVNVSTGDAVQDSALMDFSAACLYFGTGLTDKMKQSAAATGEPPVPLGMMGVSWGGTSKLVYIAMSSICFFGR